MGQREVLKRSNGGHALEARSMFQNRLPLVFISMQQAARDRSLCRSVVSPSCYMARGAAQEKASTQRVVMRCARATLLCSTQQVGTRGCLLAFGQAVAKAALKQTHE